MQRFLALLALFIFALPVGLSISGCQTQTGDYCNGLGYGPKTTAVYAIDLEPKTTGVSLSWGQTGQITAPTATTCKGASAAVSSYTYGSSNLQLADISPTGAICGGTWNRQSPGGIADYTICTPPSGYSSGSCSSTSCGTVNITATAAGVTSNTVPVYIHPPVSAISINESGSSTGGSTLPTACTSQNTAGPTFTSTGTSPNVIVYGPDGTAIPSADVGTITYTPVTSSVVTINNLSSTGTGTNGATTAELPGSTVVNASVASVSAAAGYFFTCPPTSISLALNGETSATINPSTPQTLAATVTDTNGTSLTGLTMDFTSTRPENITVSAAGVVTATYATKASVNAICQPTTCNPSPIDQIGYLGNGMPVVSNNFQVTSTGQSSTLLWMASTESQYFSEVDLTNGTPSSPVKLPYIPNSMKSDSTGTNLYFGSYRELMEYSASTNALAKEDTNVPGVVLGVSPDSTTLVINDQLRDVIYLYTVSSGAYTSVGGIATDAEFSPDGKNVYITGCVPSGSTTAGQGCSSTSNGALFVHNANSGWSTYSNTFALGTAAKACTLNNNSSLVTGNYDPFCGAGVTVTIPAVGPFIAGGSVTTAHSFCPNASASPVYYPAASIGAAANAVTDKVAASNDGEHVFGASASDNTFTDIGTTIPTGACPAYSGDPLSFTTTLNQATMSQITPSEITSVVPSPDSSVAFVTYTGTSASGLLPYYQTAATSGAAGTLNYLQLSGSAQAPVAGIFSPDESIFFVSTTGDDLVHYVSTSTLKDTQTINPGLVTPSGAAAPVQMMVVKPRSTT